MSQNFGRLSRKRILLLGVSASVVLLSVGCTADGKEDQAKPSASAAPSSPQASTTGTEEEPSGSVTAPPEIPDMKLLASVANVQGNMEVPLKDGVRQAPLGIAISCQGKGTMNVTYAPSGLSFPLQCADDTVSTTYNQIDLKHKRASASVSVRAPNSVRWAMSVGQ
ncbi:hypothetical protein R6L23_06160 [Streptomyces sp. SR27]|uniref:hypothetical protein n=2 Tax=unclassified Streptomyces TaxID=2593676 RepID=UPI00295B3D7D|nr:hypothetical protein [Streptomyces sp. SR27]MDV9187798.1 hypothetical protein [Streptomyces sp. SR27]